MAQSPEWTKMQAELKLIVIPELRGVGFKGTFPHYRRLRDGKAELISFVPHNQHGGAFEVGASIIFIDAVDEQQSNWFNPYSKTDNNKLTWASGRIRNGLPGMFEGAFFYTDTYVRHFDWTDSNTQKHFKGSHYEALTYHNKKHLLNELINNGFELVQKADDEIYNRVATEVNEQMRDLLIWFDSIKSFDDLRVFQEQQITKAKR